MSSIHQWTEAGGSGTSQLFRTSSLKDIRWSRLIVSWYCVNKKIKHNFEKCFKWKMEKFNIETGAKTNKWHFTLSLIWNCEFLSSFKVETASVIVEACFVLSLNNFLLGWMKSCWFLVIWVYVSPPAGHPGNHTKQRHRPRRDCHAHIREDWCEGRR